MDLKQINRFEGQAAMQLECIVAPELPDQSNANNAYVLPLDTHCGTLDWQPLVEQLLDDINTGLSPNYMSTHFHRTLSAAAVEVARWIGMPHVVLGGGCFQNKYLCEHTIDQLRKAGFKVYWPQRIPPNDGGIALGQIVAAAKPNS